MISAHRQSVFLLASVSALALAAGEKSSAHDRVHAGDHASRVVNRRILDRPEFPAMADLAAEGRFREQGSYRFHAIRSPRRGKGGLFATSSRHGHDHSIRTLPVRTVRRVFLPFLPRAVPSISCVEIINEQYVINGIA